MVFSDGMTLFLERPQIVALRKALALAVIADEQLPEEDRKLTREEREWIAQLERELWPGWRPKHERRYPGPKP